MSDFDYQYKSFAQSCEERAIALNAEIRKLNIRVLHCDKELQRAQTFADTLDCYDGEEAIEYWLAEGIIAEENRRILWNEFKSLDDDYYSILGKHLRMEF